MIDTSAQVLAAATARLVKRDDLAGNLVAMLTDCTHLLGAQAAGVLVTAPGGRLELLSATSHAATQLELYELQHGSGPCVDSVHTGRTNSVISPVLDDAWPPLGRSIVEAGYHSVHAFPMRWHDDVFGALNIFHTTTVQLDADLIAVASAFADLITALVAQPAGNGVDAITDQVLRALDDRNAIEQAKGVLAYRDGLDLAEAYDDLVREAVAAELPLVAVAQSVLDSTHTAD